MNYFKLFQIEQKSEVDCKLLSYRFYKLQRQFHPDHAMHLSQQKQKAMLKQSIIINQGYKILKNPFLRYQYLLSLYGFSLQNKNHLKNKKKFLMEQFNLSERFEIFQKNGYEINEFHNIKSFIHVKIKKYQLQIQSELDKKQWNLAINTLYKLSFYQKKIIDIQKIEIKLNI
ncbi:Co-chaperone protein HscB [Buchnera aphidicola (Phyllaphis fagi)]|uniref:Fe-S protein assembly co-chaperone HscB n=1 Tax=Buchnera aphidicola TaxID=9 RepID=UPI003464CDD5